MEAVVELEVEVAVVATEGVPHLLTTAVVEDIPGLDPAPIHPVSTATTEGKRSN